MLKTKPLLVNRINAMLHKWSLAAILATAGFANVQAQVNNDEPMKVIYPEDSMEVTIQELPLNKKKDGKRVWLDKEAKLNKKLAKDSAKIARDWTKWKPNPKKALWLAIVLPGAGQIYNRKYWKLPIFYGGITGCIYAMTWNNQMYRDYSQAYIDILDNDPNTQSYNDFLHLGTTITDSNKEYYQNLFKKRKDRYRRWRDLSIFATIGIYALSVIDAYVDASLSDFDISDDLSLHIAPKVINDNSIIGARNPLKSAALGIGCSLNF